MHPIVSLAALVAVAYIIASLEETEQEDVGTSPKYDRIRAKYGDPKTVPHPGYPLNPKLRGHVKCSPEWVKANIVKVKLHTGKTVQLHKAIAENFRLTFQAACLASGYTPAVVWTWVPRHINRNVKDPLSLHTWGIAVDFDSTLNPMGGKRKNGSPSVLRGEAGKAFVAVFKAAGWTWGGDWGMRDDMHFEVV